VALGSFIGAGRSLDSAIRRVRRAEELGYESVWVTHIAGRDSTTLLTVYAANSERVRLGTGVVPIYARTPANMAQSFATLDEFSGGRGVAGLGVSHKPVVDGWYGQSIDKPLAEMREYVEILRAIFRGDDPPPGEKFRTGFHFMGYEPLRADLPIYLAGLSPGMLRLAGEIADGVVLWLCNPHYIRDVVVPTVREGREKAGKELDGFDIVAAVPSAVADDAQAALDQLRSELLTYFSLPYYRAMIKLSGFEEAIAAFDRAIQDGDPQAALAAIPDSFLRLLAAIGTPEEAIATVRHYRECGTTSPCIGGISGTDFDVTLEALAKSLD
jgi:alkanesulfonate monooxygenase SsuD/methylene tetrahydromethanopterin reductase-like flavin-dependent oxidoreductase (luciferase family)